MELEIIVLSKKKKNNDRDRKVVIARVVAYTDKTPHVFFHMEIILYVTGKLKGKLRERRKPAGGMRVAG